MASQYFTLMLFGTAASFKPRSKGSTSNLDEQLFSQQWAKSQSRLKASWESIFAKYECDTSDFADEIDLKTGEIVVDNGHLRGLEMRQEKEDLWSTWIEEKVCVEEGTSGCRGGGNTSPVYSLNDCVLCADRDELEFTPCTHSPARRLEDKNTPILPSPVIALQQLLSASTPVGPKPRTSTLTIPRKARKTSKARKTRKTRKTREMPPPSPIVSQQQPQEEDDRIVLHSKWLLLYSEGPEPPPVAVDERSGAPPKFPQTPIDTSNKPATSPVEIAKGSPCGTKGYICRKAVCWICLDAEDDEGL